MGTESVLHTERRGREREVGGGRERETDRQRTTPVLLLKRSYTSLLS